MPLSYTEYKNKWDEKGITPIDLDEGLTIGKLIELTQLLQRIGARHHDEAGANGTLGRTAETLSEALTPLCSHPRFYTEKEYDRGMETLSDLSKLLAGKVPGGDRNLYQMLRADIIAIGREEGVIDGEKVCGALDADLETIAGFYGVPMELGKIHAGMAPEPDSVPEPVPEQQEELPILPKSECYGIIARLLSRSAEEDDPAVYSEVRLMAEASNRLSSVGQHDPDLGAGTKFYTKNGAVEIYLENDADARQILDRSMGRLWGLKYGNGMTVLEAMRDKCKADEKLKLEAAIRFAQERHQGTEKPEAHPYPEAWHDEDVFRENPDMYTATKHFEDLKAQPKPKGVSALCRRVGELVVAHEQYLERPLKKFDPAERNELVGGFVSDIAFRELTSQMNKNQLSAACDDLEAFEKQLVEKKQQIKSYRLPPERCNEYQGVLRGVLDGILAGCVAPERTGQALWRRCARRPRLTI